MNIFNELLDFSSDAVYCATIRAIPDLASNKLDSPRLFQLESVLDEALNQSSGALIGEVNKASDLSFFAVHSSLDEFLIGPDQE